MAVVIGILIAYLILVAVLAHIIYDFKAKRETRIRNLPHLLFITECHKLTEKKPEYLKAFTNEAEYTLLDELYKKLPIYYKAYASSILNTPLVLYKPVSPDTAAIIGTAMGGTAVGIVAAMNAREREAAYRQNALDVIRSQIETGSAYEQLHKCYSTIIAIINTKENTKNDWDNTKFLISKEIDEKHRKEYEEKKKKCKRYKKFYTCIYFYLYHCSAYVFFLK